MTQPMGTGAVENTATPADATFTAFAKGIAQAPPTVREKLAAQLKRAGLYKGKISSEFDNKFYDAEMTIGTSKLINLPFFQRFIKKYGTGWLDNEFYTNIQKTKYDASGIDTPGDPNM